MLPAQVCDKRVATQDEDEQDPLDIVSCMWYEEVGEGYLEDIV